MRPQMLILFTTLTVNTACSVDLDRREGTLRLSAVSDDPKARGLRVRVSEGPDIEPYEGTHTSNLTPFSVQIPDLSVLPGEVDVEAQLVNEAGEPMGQASLRRLGVSRDETTAWVFEFLSEMTTSTSAPDDGSSPVPIAMPVTGASPTELRVTARPSSAEVASGAVVLSLDGGPLDAALEPLERQLLGPPTSLKLKALAVEIAEVNEDDPSQTTPGELNDLFPDRVTVELRGAGVSTPLAQLLTNEASRLELDLTPAVSVVDWTSRPSNAAIVLSGASYEGTEEPDFEVRVHVRLAGAN